MYNNDLYVPVEDYYVELDDWIEIVISGNQTIEYLNGIITRDLNHIGEDVWVRSSFLTPNAKIRSVYWMKKTEDGVVLVCPGNMKEALIEDLLKYKLSMDVKLEDVTEETPDLYLVTSEQRLPGLSTDKFGFTFTHSDNPPEGQRLSTDEFYDMLTEHGIIPPTVMTEQNPYEIGIEDVISLEKGCFLGQEPISRMYHRGNPRKYVYQISFEGEPESDKITLDDDEVGELLTSVSTNGTHTGLAYIRRTVDDHDNLYLSDQKITVMSRVGDYPANDR